MHHNPQFCTIIQIGSKIQNLLELPVVFLRIIKKNEKTSKWIWLMDEKSFGLNHGFVSLPWHIVWGIIGVIVPRREMCILLLLWMSMIAVELRPVWKPGLMSTRVIFGFDCPGIIPLGIIVFLGSTLFHYRWHLSPVKKNPKFNFSKAERGRPKADRAKRL